MKEYSEAEIKGKAEVYCSSVERCPSDVEEKIRKWGFGGSDRTDYGPFAERTLPGCGSFLPDFMCATSTVSISGGG